MSTIGSGISSAVGAAPANTPNRFSELTSEEFMRVLFTELSNQDPLDPQDSSKMLEQLSSIRNIESQLKLQQKIEDLVAQNKVASAGNLIGKVVSGRDEYLNEASGKVMAVRVAGDKIHLELNNGKRVNMASVTSIAPAPAN